MIVCIVPTIREEQHAEFVKAWTPLFEKHHIRLVTVWDGDNPTVEGFDARTILGEDSELIYNKSDVVRNLGFIYAKKTFNPDIYLTLDDDVRPHGDSIQGHLDALEKHFPAHWMSTASEYVRGVPYGIRNEMECVVSHGVWHGVKDWDAPTQLVRGNPDVDFYKGHFPKGVYFPFCGMNVAFKAKALPYMYYAPMGYRVKLDRFGDIWLGINLKRECDDRDWAIATGYSAVKHERASNVWANLRKEAPGLELNEEYWSGNEDHPYFQEYQKQRSRWEMYVRSL